MIDPLERILTDVAEGQLNPIEAVDFVRSAFEDDLGFARVDHDRRRRRGFPEVVYCEGKSIPQVVGIATSFRENASRALFSRVRDDQIEPLRATLGDVRWDSDARMMCWPAQSDASANAGSVVVISAGTSDRPVMAEAAMTAQFLGCPTSLIEDVGVAGLHRLLRRVDQLRAASCVIAVAGMDGALPSVVAGLVTRPVIAVPTSVGYGAAMAGMAPLLSMLMSCSPGIAVVNIDNGFGAGYLAAQIATPVVPES